MIHGPDTDPTSLAPLVLSGSDRWVSLCIHTSTLLEPGLPVGGGGDLPPTLKDDLFVHRTPLSPMTPTDPFTVP